jgi:hypothetical protein
MGLYLLYVIPFWNAYLNITDLIIDVDVGFKPDENNVNWQIELIPVNFDFKIEDVTFGWISWLVKSLKE